MLSKKRKYGSSNIRKNTSGGYIYQTYTYYGSESGKKILKQKYIGKVSKSVLNKNREDWDTYFDEIDYNTKNKNPFTKPPQPFALIIEKWIVENTKKYELNDISASTLRFNKENINLFLRWYLTEYGDKQIERVTTLEINNYRDYRRGLGLSDNTISINLRAIRTFFKWALKEQYIEYTPFTTDIDIPKYKPRLDEDVPMGADWKRLYNFISDSISFKEIKKAEKQKFDWFNHNDWFKYMIWIMCNTGMRGGEVRILKWKKGKFDSTAKRKSFSYLDKELTKIHIYFKGSYGEIPITKKLKSVFEDLKKKNGTNTYIFQSPITNEEIDKGVFNKLFRKLMNDLGLVDDVDGKPLYSPHSIRHSVASDLLAKGINIYNISKLLRHSDIRTTLNIYGHLLPSDLENTMDKIGV